MNPRALALLGLVRGRKIEVGGLPLWVPRGVLDPTLFRVGAAFALEVRGAVRPGERLLDLGCGSGVVGALAQAAGAEVVAVDLDPRAIAAARENGIRDARQGDLFAPVQGERFDWICFNPPFFAGRGRGRIYRRALYGGADLEVPRRFVASVAAHLRPGGRAWVAWSDRAPPAAAVLGPGWREERRLPLEGEVLSVWGLSLG